jgi:hypothetical protein
MLCFCHQALQPLGLALPSLNVSVSVAMPQANLALGLANWLGARALPAAPWLPDLNWLTLPLPHLQLNASAMATISALAQLRAQVLAQFGIDLLVPGQAAAFAQIVATLHARVSAMAALSPGFNPLAWLRLASLNAAIDQLNLALKIGLPLALPPLPGGLPWPSWRQFLAALSALVPLIAVAAHLNLNLSENFSAQLSLALRALLNINLPALPSLRLMASLTAALSAVAQLQASLGVNPLEIGLPAVQLMISARLSVVLQALSSAMGFNLLTMLLDELLALLPAIPYSPASLATSAVVQAAMSINAQALASLNWQVPSATSLIAVRVGLPAVAFAAQLRASLGINAAITAPCGSGCDAAAIMAAL